MTTYSHVHDLLSSHDDQLDGLVVPHYWMMLVKHTWLIPFWKASITRRVNDMTRKLEDQSLRLSGYVHRFPRVSELMSAEYESELLDLVCDFEDSCMAVRTSILSMIAQVKPLATKLPKLFAALQDWNSAAVDAWESAQDLRWVILESQAQRDIDQGKVQRFDSAAAAIASLRS